MNQCLSTKARASPLIDGRDPQRIERRTIEEMVKRRQLKVLVTTDAASEGLNLRRLRTLINIDLPWNPARLKQRKSCIERIWQETDTIDILNLRYHNSIEDDVHRALSHCRRDIRDIFGTLPDTWQDVWVHAAEGEIGEAKRLIEAVPRSHSFILRYTTMVPTLDRDKCEQVINRLDLIGTLKRPW
jgi:hypothetical protein